MPTIASVSRLSQIIRRFPNRRILVVGDLMMDRFIWGSVTRISPEAPVPVVEVTRETEMPGGAGNVVNNLSALQAEVSVIGIVGRDGAADSLLHKLSGPQVNLDGVLRQSERPTILKTRIIAHHQQVVRIDHEQRGSLPRVHLQALLEKIRVKLPKTQAVIISDYGKNVVDPALLRMLIPMAKRLRIPVLVDPKIEHFQRYKRVTCLTPNTLEAVQGMRAAPPKTDEEFLALGRSILKKLRTDSLLITQGEKGMSLFEPGNRVTRIPTRAREVFDVTGAGDTVISVFALALASGANFREAAEVSNYAAGVVVGKIGTATLSCDELQGAIRQK